jgi:hypothetical protein
MWLSVFLLILPACWAKTFYYTGAYQNYTVPAGIEYVRVTVVGAYGGNLGYGVQLITTLPVSAGQLMWVVVGGAGGSTGVAGYNGGAPGVGTGNGGGGASDIRSRPEDLSARLIVAAGGGGGVGTSSTYGGGDGGCIKGTQGNPITTSIPYGGFGGTQTAGGAGGNSTAGKGSPGTLGFGGAGNAKANSGGGGGGSLFYFCFSFLF